VFITFEGPEGAGKTTVIEAVATFLRSQGREIHVTREPGAGVVGEAVREILLGGTAIAPLAELFLFLADRAQHVACEIRPALERNAIVLCDRYADSTIVYQGYARGMDLEKLRELNGIATKGLQPNLTLLFDLEPSVGLARIRSKDRLDSEPIQFHEKVRQGFLAEARRDPQRFRIINADRPPLEVIQEAINQIVLPS
jgi:dTMP kinase